MTKPQDFTPEEWDILRVAPHAVGMAVAVAGASGLTGTMKEAWSSATAVLEGIKSDNEILKGVADKEEMKAAQSKIRATVKEGDFKTLNQRMQDLAADNARDAIRLLERKGSPADVAAYRSYLLGVGERAMLKRLEDAVG